MAEKRQIYQSVAMAAAVASCYVAGQLVSPVFATGLAVASATALLGYAVLHTKRLLAEMTGEVLVSAQLAAVPLMVAPAWTPYSLSPRLIARLLQEVVLRDVTHIVECGSGVSTVMLAKCLSGLGRGHVYSIEHDPMWAAHSERLIHANGLQAFATVVLAPIAASDVLGQTVRWYDQAVVEAAIPQDRRIGMLVVDGPPASTGRLARLGAVPVLGSRLLPGALVVVDDIHRADEQEVAQLWSSAYGLTLEELRLDEGYGFFRCRD